MSLGMMTCKQPTPTAARVKTSSASMLRWTFRRGHREVTCEVRVGTEGTAGVHITADGDRRRPIIEPAPTAVAAFRRHAEIAMMLRDAGWSTHHRTI
jgi:hypothetical protein